MALMTCEIDALTGGSSVPTGQMSPQLARAYRDLADGDNSAVIAGRSTVTGNLNANYALIGVVSGSTSLSGSESIHTLLRLVRGPGLYWVLGFAQDRFYGVDVSVPIGLWFAESLRRGTVLSFQDAGVRFETVSDSEAVMARRWLVTACVRRFDRTVHFPRLEDSVGSRMAECAARAIVVTQPIIQDLLGLPITEITGQRLNLLAKVLGVVLGLVGMVRDIQVEPILVPLSGRVVFRVSGEIVDTLESLDILVGG